MTGSTDARDRRQTPARLGALPAVAAAGLLHFPPRAPLYRPRRPAAPPTHPTTPGVRGGVGAEPPRAATTPPPLMYSNELNRAFRVLSESFPRVRFAPPDG